jgi:hypothetical protein
MRQFECEDGLDRLLATGRVGPHELERFGRDLAAIHDGLPVAQDPQDWGRSAVVCGQILENIAQCLQLSEPLGTQAELRRLCEPFVAGLRVLGPWIDARRRAGHVRECHGDLHSRNVVRYAGRLIGFDCIDFEPAFRWIDVAEEIAFLLMDLDARRCPLHAQAFLGGYLSQSGDYQACRLLRTYGIHRALVRTKVTALEGSSASQPYVRTLNIESHKAYVECIHRLLEPGRPMLILMHGLSGSGKTWLASRIAPLLGAVHVRSDVERKRLAGLGQSESSHSAMEEGLYSPFSNQRVYEHLRRCADDVLAGGYTVIVDATFGRRDDRERFRSLAAARAAELCVVDCHAPQQRLESRLVERQRDHSDASEADLAVLAWQQSHLEPIAAAEQLAVIDADTTREAIVSEVYDSLREQARNGAKR